MTYQHALPHMCYHAEFGRSALKVRENPKDWGALELRSLGRRDVSNPNIHAPPHICYHVKFGSSATKGVRINRRKSPKLGVLWPRSLGAGRGLPGKNNYAPLSMCVVTSNLVVLR